jgi:hypothetical protein
LRARKRKCGALDYIAKQNKRDASEAKVKCAVATGPHDGRRLSHRRQHHLAVALNRR